MAASLHPNHGERVVAGQRLMQSASDLFLGSSRVFDDAMSEFAVEYADQAQRDYRAFVRAVRRDQIKAA